MSKTWNVFALSPTEADNELFVADEEAGIIEIDGGTTVTFGQREDGIPAVMVRWPDGATAFAIADPQAGDFVGDVGEGFDD